VIGKSQTLIVVAVVAARESQTCGAFRFASVETSCLKKRSDCVPGKNCVPQTLYLSEKAITPVFGSPT